MKYNRLPLSKRKTFLNHKSSSSSKEPRKNILEHAFKNYDEVYKTMIREPNEGPGKYNIRECKEQRTGSVKTSLPIGQREMGAPKHLTQTPDPGAYYRDKCAVYKNFKFSKQPRRVDFIKYKSGMEEFTVKGLI